jgi:hypothetical protein
MQYMITWNERPQGSPIDYENAQKRILHKFCSMLPAFTFEARPVVPVADAIRVELEAMAYREGLKNK